MAMSRCAAALRAASGAAPSVDNPLRAGAGAARPIKRRLEMVKRIGLSAAVLVALIVLAAPAPASAEVRFGVTIGTPGYVYPATPYAYPYVNPYAYSYSYPYSNYYGYPAPGYYGYTGSYYAPSYSFGFGRSGDHRRHEWREHERHERHERREHGFRGRGRR
jgi:hypothetical protein